MSVLSTALAAIIFILLGFLHIYWGLGGTWWRQNIVPEKDGRPIFRLFWSGLVFVACLLFSAAIVVLANAKMIFLPVPEALLVLGRWTIFTVFLLRFVGDFRYAGIFKKITDTSFAYWDNRVYSPLCLVIAALVAL